MKLVQNIVTAQNRTHSPKINPFILIRNYWQTKRTSEFGISTANGLFYENNNYNSIFAIIISSIVMIKSIVPTFSGTFSGFFPRLFRLGFWRTGPVKRIIIFSYLWLSIRCKRHEIRFCNNAVYTQTLDKELIRQTNQKINKITTITARRK